MTTEEIARIAANIENHRDDLGAIEGTGQELLKQYHLDGLKIVGYESYELQPGEYYLPGQDCSEPLTEYYIKAITLMDGDGNLYVHFFGTGDGNWGFNSVAYSDKPYPSSMQEWALNYFNSAVAEYSKENPMKSVFVSGHSQGGNLAQYVTLESSQYGDYIDKCVSLDGPGFSTTYLEDYIDRHGEAVYDKQRDKIWQYIGENDYVSTLGQEFVYNENHVRFLKYTKGGFDPGAFHGANGLVDENGNIYIVDDDSAFRKFVVNAVNKIKELPSDKQARAAELTMMLCEDLLGKEKSEIFFSNMTPEEFEEFKELMGPLLVEILADTPEMIRPVLEQFGLSPEAADAVAELIEHINTFSPSEREVIIESVLGLLDYENGEIKLNYQAIPAVIVTAWPVILETVLTHPEDIVTVLHELGVDAAIATWIEENPLQFIGVCIGLSLSAPLWMPIAEALVVVGVLIDAGIRIVQAIEWLDGKIKDAVLKTFAAIKNAISAIAKWYRSNTAGVKYVANNPYFKADTAKLRNYATRINRVNSRLKSLDSAMRSLYWQVGFLDLWDILCANLVTSGSPTLNQVKSYLNNTADRLDNAENKAKGYVGG